MRYKVLCCIAILSLKALVAGGQSFSFAFYDEDLYQEHVEPRVPNYPEVPEGSIVKGYLFSYQSALSQPYGVIALFGGMDLGYWSFIEEENIYTYASHISTKISLFPTLFLHPFVEVSFGGPTYISSTEFGGMNFSSNFIFQNYISIGMDLTAATLKLQMIHYGKDLKKGFTTPLIGSVGLNF